MNGVVEGGSGSGNFGHAGRPGAIGGSGEGGGGDAPNGGGSAKELTKDGFSSFSKKAEGVATPRMRKTIDDYQNTSHRTVNTYLRSPDDVMKVRIKQDNKDEVVQVAQEKIRILDSTFEAMPGLENDTVVYRGFKVKDLGVSTAQELVGKTITDKGYTSTTVSRDIAKDFGNTYMEIEVGKGTRAIPVGALSPSDKYDDEEEILLKRSSSFEITGIKHEGMYTVLRAKYREN